jgi:hypothetical protein
MISEGFLKGIEHNVQMVSPSRNREYIRRHVGRIKYMASYAHRQSGVRSTGSEKASFIQLAIPVIRF